ncbi:MAG: TrkA C-terminal domain-containing protein, partial [Clostridia bacterium]|nr:TrkA C-terminal domain-containing protein [Clostridia bacterium]
TELFTMLFRLIGLPEEKARFQVTSLLTGCGFTTRESEMILTSRRRRRLARVTMLFGYVFNITVVSAFINVFLSLKLTQLGGYVAGVLIPLGVVAVVVILMRIPAVRAWTEKLLRKLAGSIMHEGAENSVMLIDHIGKGSIAEVTLSKVPELLLDKPLFLSGIKEEQNILIMLFERGGKVEPPLAQTVFAPGDKLTVFGDYQQICRVFNAKERFD